MRRLPAMLSLALVVALPIALIGCAPPATVTPGPAATATPGGTTAAPEAGLVNPAPATQPTPVRTVVPGTRREPAQIGETVRVTIIDTGYEVTITEAITGDEAAARVREANPFNEPPGEGREFVLFFTQAGVLSTPGDEAAFVDEFLWSEVDSTGEILTPPAIVDPEPEFTGRGFPGATVEGWSTFTRRIDEPVFLVFGLQPDGTGGAWFAVPGG